MNKKTKKKAKRRYRSSQEIIDRIEQSKAEARNMIRQAEGLDLHAMEIDRWGKPTYVEDANMKRQEAKRLRKKAQRIWDVRIEELKQKLAVIQTGVLPGIKMDRSVV